MKEFCLALSGRRLAGACFELKIAILHVNFNKVKEKLKNIKISFALTKLRCILIMLKLIKD